MCDALIERIRNPVPIGARPKLLFVGLAADERNLGENGGHLHITKHDKWGASDSAVSH